MNLRPIVGAALVVGALGTLVLAACGSSRSGGFTGQGGPGAGPGGGDVDGSTFAQTPDATAAPAPVVGWLHGKVVAPEGTVPVSNAIVYLTSNAPDAIPGSVYCDTCIHLTPLEPYAYTKTDGTFELAAYATGAQFLVVQKGQFRRVRPITVARGDQNVQPDMTRLPGKTDAANGDTIPKIAMAVGGFDAIDYSLSKLGIQEFYRYGDGPVGLPGSDGPGTKTNMTTLQLIASSAELAKYHIALMPCAALGYQQSQTDDSNVCGAPTDATKNALDVYVQSGGKLYVTDYAYEAVRQTWPGFITWYDDLMNPLDGTQAGVGTACRAGSETTQGTAEDKGLADWMTAIGETDLQLQASWTRIASVQAQPGVDPTGKSVTITPKVWMTSDVDGTKLPATVSFEQKCGRVLFSTYHCEGDSRSQLLAQEKALLYVLLEVGVCVGQLPPPPPPR